jgi:hypothetical protein
MRIKKTQSLCESAPTDPKQASIGIEMHGAIERRKKKEFRRKRENHIGKISLGVNLPQMTQGKTPKVKIELANLFKTEINHIMREFKLRTDDWEDW